MKTDPRNKLEKALAREEPVFVVTASDMSSLAAITAYDKAKIMASKPYDEELFDQFIKWQLENKEKLV